MSKRERQPSQSSSSSAVIKKTKPSKGIAELDDIFATKKAAAVEKKEEEEKKANEAAKSKAGNNHRTGSSGSTNTKKLTFSRHDVEDVAPNSWVNDGLGGKFNREGYTGRVEGGVKVFKAHLFNKKNFGQSKDCPFDCDCCYI